MPAETFRNTILQHLSSDTIRRLKLRRIQLALRQDLEVPGQKIESIYFVEQGIGSMTTVFRDGFEVEVSMFGYESAVGDLRSHGDETQSKSSFHAAWWVWLCLSS